jgi:deoxyadenosine/deoxycytidine kinase
MKRAFEASIADEYLLRLDRLYDAWIAGYDLSPVVTLDMDHLDLFDDADREGVWALLERHGLDAPRLA